MSIIFTSNLSLELSSCFSSFSAKSERRISEKYTVGPWSIQHHLTGVEKSSSLITDSGMAVPEITLQNQDGKNSGMTEGEKTHTQANIPSVVPKVKS